MPPTYIHAADTHVASVPMIALLSQCRRQPLTGAPAAVEMRFHRHFPLLSVRLHTAEVNLADAAVQGALRLAGELDVEEQCSDDCLCHDFLPGSRQTDYMSL